MEAIEVIRRILDLGWPGIVTIMVLTVWRAYVKRTDEYIQTLSAIVTDCDKLRIAEALSRANSDD